MSAWNSWKTGTTGGVANAAVATKTPCRVVDTHDLKPGNAWPFLVASPAAGVP